MEKENVKINTSISKNEPLHEVGQLSLDIFDNTKELVIIAPIAGVKKDDIEITITEDILVIRGTRRAPEEIPEKSFITKECFWGDFARSIILPREADINKISANFQNSVLEIRIAKQENSKAKIIKIEET